MSELKPCPFCGYVDEVTIDSSSAMECSTAHCNDCGTYLQAPICEEDLVRRWNTRPLEDTLRTRVTELEAAKQDLLEKVFEQETEVENLKSELMAVENYEEEMRVLRGEVKELTRKGEDLCCAFGNTDLALKQAEASVENMCCHYMSIVSTANIAIEQAEAEVNRMADKWRKAEDELEYLKSPEGRSAERLCASLKEIRKVAELEAELAKVKPVVEKVKCGCGHNKESHNDVGGMTDAEHGGCDHCACSRYTAIQQLEGGE